MIRAVASSLGRTATARRPLRNGAQAAQARSYRHWWRTTRNDYFLPDDSIPADVPSLMSKKPDNMGFVDSYWYWRIRAEATILDPEQLPKKSYKQLARDLGLNLPSPASETTMGLIELWEYLKGGIMVGPFGTIENPVIIPSVHHQRVVTCTGGSGDNEHAPLSFMCKEGFLYRCGECDQIFMHARIMYDAPDEERQWAKQDWSGAKDVFDFAAVKKTHARWNRDGMVVWDAGNAAVSN